MRRLLRRRYHSAHVQAHTARLPASIHPHGDHDESTETRCCRRRLVCCFRSFHAGATFDNVKKKGFVQCGVSTGIPGFSIADSKGEWKGLDVDLCRAIAATMFGDASKIKVTPLNTQQRFTALQSGEVDVLTRNTTVTLTRDTTLGLIGVGVNYDSQGVMVSRT